MNLFAREQILDQWRGSGDLKNLASLLRANALTLIQDAGSGHIGSSFSVMDLLVAIHSFEQGGLFPEGPTTSYRVFSSKGHDAPAFYAMNHFLGIIPDDAMKLRRLGYLPGHPEIGSGGSIANTGSLGMGISKAKGFAAADHLLGAETTTYVVLGDGELQEGQIWESIADGSKVLGNLVAIVDGNSIQSDTWTNRTRDLGDVRLRVEACGWKYLETDGHNFDELKSVLSSVKRSPAPTLIWAKTTKGKGSPILTHFPENGRFYHAHSGALSEPLAGEVLNDLLGKPSHNRLPNTDFSTSPKMTPRTMPNVWAEVLLERAIEREDLTVFDGDLTLDTGTYLVANHIGPRYFQMGVAEQDMVSMAGALALSGFTPIVHSFSTFLTMRPFEQIVNNASEFSRVIYCGFLSGIVPSAAGFSHQAVLDLSIMTSVPGMKIFEPATQIELETAFDFALKSDGPTYLRMNSVPPVDLPGEFFPDESNLGTRFGEGQDFKILCSGAFSLNNALGALEALEAIGIRGQVRTFTNKTSHGDIFEDVGRDKPPIILVENGVWYQGTLSSIESEMKLSGQRFDRVAITGFPANGQPDEVAKHHGMDSGSLVSRILGLIDE